MTGIDFDFLKASQEASSIAEEIILAFKSQNDDLDRCLRHSRQCPDNGKHPDCQT
jgi:hypothetical protein